MIFLMFLLLLPAYPFLCQDSFSWKKLPFNQHNSIVKIFIIENVFISITRFIRVVWLLCCCFSSTSSQTQMLKAYIRIFMHWRWLVLWKLNLMVRPVLSALPSLWSNRLLAISLPKKKEKKKKNLCKWKIGVWIFLSTWVNCGKKNVLIICRPVIYTHTHVQAHANACVHVRIHHTHWIQQQ